MHLPICVILIGLPASGKSSFYQAKFRDTHVRINGDMLRTPYREKLFIDACLQTSMPHVIDKANVERAVRVAYVKAARARGFRVIGYHLLTTSSESLCRNAVREGSARVPDVAVRGFASRFEAPSIEEGFDELYRVESLLDGGFDITPL